MGSYPSGELSLFWVVVLVGSCFGGSYPGGELS